MILFAPGFGGLLRFGVLGRDWRLGCYGPNCCKIGIFENFPCLGLGFLGIFRSLVFCFCFCLFGCVLVTLLILRIW